MFPVEYLAVLSCPLNLKQYCYYIQFNCPVGGGVISNNAVDLGRHCLGFFSISIIMFVTVICVDLFVAVIEFVIFLMLSLCLSGTQIKTLQVSLTTGAHS